MPAAFSREKWYKEWQVRYRSVFYHYYLLLTAQKLKSSGDELDYFFYFLIRYGLFDAARSQT